MRLHRLIGIIMLLDSRGMMKAGNLSKILETSERTIYRDIDILCEAGIPIMSTAGPSGGFSFVDGYRITSNTLGKRDVMNLLLSSTGIRMESSTETAQELKNAVIKLENSVSEEHRQEIISAREKFFYDSEPWWGKRTENKNIDLIRKAILELKKIKINYKKYGGEVSERIIRPYGAVVKIEEWYVAAFCEERKEVRVFKCSRMQDAEILEEHYDIPQDFSLEEFWKKSKLQFAAQVSSDTRHSIFPVKIKFFEEKKKLLNGFDVIYHEKVEDGWIYGIDMISFETACSMLFPLSDRVQVIEPEEIKYHIINKARRILNLNKSMTY